MLQYLELLFLVLLFLVKYVSEVDNVLATQDDVQVPLDDVDVWIDPLDATQEYTENLLQYVTTMVCVAVKGVPIIGVIHKPFEDITAWGWVGPNLISDALRENLEDSSRVELDKSRLIVSRSHAGSIHDVAAKLFGSEVQVQHFEQLADFVDLYGFFFKINKSLCFC